MRAALRSLSLCASLLAVAAPAAAAEELWPAFTDWPSQGGGADDAAVVVGIESYAVAPPVGGAVSNANDWMQYFTESRKIPAERVTLLRNNEGTLEKMKKFAEQAAKDVRPGGTLWFVFIGHGAPARDGKDGVLVGFDAQQDVDSLYARSLAKKELLAILERGPQGKTVAVIDACFSGRAGTKALVEGLQPLLPVISVEPAGRSVVMTAGTANEFAGPLPGAARPAFSYLVLGGLRGWADTDKNEKVTAGEAVDYAKKALRATVKDRSQTPELSGDGAYALTDDSDEKGPELSKIMLRLGNAGGGSGAASEVTFGAGTMIAMAPKIDVKSAGGDFVNTNIEAERAYESAVLLDRAADTAPDAKATAWCQLSAITTGNPYLSGATEACAQWTRYVQNRNTTLASLAGDYGKLQQYLTLKLKTQVQRLAAADAYLAAYGTFAEEERVQNVANARVDLDSASGDSDAAEVSLPEITTSSGSSDWDIEIDPGDIAFFGSDDMSELFTLRFVYDGLQPFGDGEFLGSTSTYLFGISMSSGPIEFTSSWGWATGTYHWTISDKTLLAYTEAGSSIPIDPTTGQPLLYAGLTGDVEWSGVALRQEILLNLVGWPDPGSSDFSLLNLGAGLRLEEVIGQALTPTSSPWFGAGGLVFSEKVFLGCSFGVAAEYYVPLGHEDVWQQRLGALLFIAPDRSGC